MPSFKITAKTPLARFLVERWKKMGISMREFARRIEVSSVFVLHVKSGEMKFPPEQFARWSKGLELDQEQEEEFLRLTLIAQAAPELQKFIRNLESRRSAK